MSQPVKRCYAFGEFRLDVAERRLLRHGETIPLTPKVFDTLLLLVENPGHLVEKDEFMKRLWPATFVGEDALARNISLLRKAVGGTSDSQALIATVPTRGYRFVAAVTEMSQPHQDAEQKETADTSQARRERTTTEEERLGGRFPVGQAIARDGAGVREGSRPREPAASDSRPGRIALVVVALAVGSLAGLVTFLLLSPAPAPAPRVIRSVAVLPLENLSGDPAQDYFADGMTEQLITDLGQISSLRVISRTSVNHYKGTKKPLPEIARELGVDVLVEGTFTLTGNHVRVTTNLVQALPERHLWAETYERELSDVLQLQTEVTRAIANQIRAELTPAEQTRLARSPTTSLEAQQSYLKGRYFWNKRTEEGLEKSLEYFQQAVGKDPNYALAYAGMADSYTILTAGEYAVLAPKEAVPKVKTAADKALQLDNSLAEPHASLGFLKSGFDWDWKGAEAEYKQAIELNPSYATAHQWYAIYLVEMGRSAEAVAEIRKAETLDPLSLIISTDHAWILYNARRYDDAIRQLHRTFELDPKFAAAHWTLGLAYSAKGQTNEAIAELQQASDLSGGLPVCVAALGGAYANAGNRAQALRILNELKNRSKHGYVLPDGIAYIYLALGNKDQAMTWLEEAYAQRTDAMPLLKVAPTLDPLRSDPRFVELLRRVNFPP